MSDTESQEKGSSNEKKDPVNPENVTELAETRNESTIEQVKKAYDQGDIITITEVHGKSPRKKGHWDSRKKRKTL